MTIALCAIYSSIYTANPIQFLYAVSEGDDLFFITDEQFTDLGLPVQETFDLILGSDLSVWTFEPLTPAQFLRQRRRDYRRFSQ